jgi:hypothetical protein
MPTTDADVWLSVRNLRSSPLLGEGQSIAAVIEQVGGFIGVGQPGSAMFKFGQSYGALRMALVAAGIPFETVPPQKWQKEFGLSRRPKETKTQYKNRLKAVAQQLYPENEPTLYTCDALLIAEYCRRKHEGLLR